ncbi:MAG: four helix bundle protein [Kofleriaceae bacterium]
MPFVAYDLSIKLILCLREPLAQVRKHSADLGRQLDRAADSVAQNLAEAGGRFGKDRLQHFRIAYGSLREAKCSLELAVAKGWLEGGEEAHGVANELGAILYRLATPRR